MRRIRHPSLIFGLCLAWAASASPALATSCGGDFAAWLETFQRDAVKQGLSQRTVAALSGISQDPKVLALDRRQHVFKQTFEQFSGRMISPQRFKKGGMLLRQHQATLARIEQRFGVPGPVIVAIWGLETDYGINTGKLPVLRSLATLAHDCRRTELFQRELLSALRIVQRGDLGPEAMRGAWAGELGQTQFLPSSYFKYAIDFDGSGKPDLIASVPDVLASTANYLKGFGWRRGEPWKEGSYNFEVLKEWNKAEVYRKTIALFAERLAGEWRSAQR